MGSNPFQNFMVRYGESERIFTEGDLGTTMFIVQSGKVRLFRLADGQKRVLGVMEKGDFFGEMAILEGLPRTSSAESLEDTELIEINSMTFDKMIKGNIEIAIRMLRKLSVRLREAERRIETMDVSGEARAAAKLQPMIRPRAATVSAANGTRLVVEGDEASGFALRNGETMVGRFDPVTEMRPDIDLTQLDLKRSVSRRHGRIFPTDDGYAITEEVGALNGTFVNGEKLVTGRPHPIRDGDQISFGMVKLVFRA